MRTPKEIIDLAIKEMGECGYVVKKVDKQAYLSAYALADYVVVTCDSTSMISEAATSGKPIFVAHMQTKRNNYRFKRFFDLFKNMGITRDLGEKIETWSYNKHNEAQRIAIELKNKIEN
jgi:mitochondrial fission protein ELM1